MRIKSNNPKLTQNQIAKDLGYSDSTLKRYRNDIKCKVLVNIPIMAPRDLKRTTCDWICYTFCK